MFDTFGNRVFMLVVHPKYLFNEPTLILRQPTISAHVTGAHLNVIMQTVVFGGHKDPQVTESAYQIFFKYFHDFREGKIHKATLVTANALPPDPDTGHWSYNSSWNILMENLN